MAGLVFLGASVQGLGYRYWGLANSRVIPYGPGTMVRENGNWRGGRLRRGTQYAQ